MAFIFPDHLHSPKKQGKNKPSFLLPKPVSHYNEPLLKKLKTDHDLLLDVPTSNTNFSKKLLLLTPPKVPLKPPPLPTVNPDTKISPKKLLHNFKIPPQTFHKPQLPTTDANNVFHPITGVMHTLKLYNSSGMVKKEADSGSRVSISKHKEKLKIPVIVEEGDFNEKVKKGGYAEKFLQFLSRDRSDYALWKHLLASDMDIEPDITVRVISTQLHENMNLCAKCSLYSHSPAFPSQNYTMTNETIIVVFKPTSQHHYTCSPSRNEEDASNHLNIVPGILVDVYQPMEMGTDLKQYFGIRSIVQKGIMDKGGDCSILLGTKWTNDSFALMAEMENPKVTLFREYLRINTMHPTPDYSSCTTFLTNLANELEIDFVVHEFVKGKPIIVMTIPGTDTSLPSVLLNSHTDVVPVNREKWTHDPFAADKVDGKIYARGSQDMKCVGLQQVEAIRELKKSGKKLLRTVHISFVPDEEIGGKDGMKKFIVSDEFKKLNVGFALDEGYANPGNAYSVFYGERAPWWIKITATGDAGHGSQFLKQTATVQLMKVINKFLAFRESEKTRLALGKNPDGSPLQLGDVTTTNLTMLKAGVQPNVVPDVAEAVIDMRVAPSFDLQLFQKQVESWCDEPGVSFEMLQQFWSNSCTAVNDANPWWKVLKGVADKRNVELETQIFPAATDCRFIREIGLPAFGISPMRNTPILLHDHDEFLSEETYLEGCDFYVDLVEAVANHV